jgi:hypothetical protein
VFISRKKWMRSSSSRTSTDAELRKSTVAATRRAQSKSAARVAWSTAADGDS